MLQLIRMIDYFISPILWIVLPIFLIRGIIRMWKNKKRHNRIKYKYIYWPLIILCVVPAFCVSTAYNMDNLESSIGELWFNILFVAFIITMIWTIIQYKIAGLWVGLIRFLIGFLIGALASVFILLGIGLIVILLFTTSDTTYIIKDGETRFLYDTHDGQSYFDKEGNEYRKHNGTLYDDNGYSYKEYGGKN